MTHTTWTRLALAFALLLSPVAFLGCAEETKAPATGDAAKAPAPAGGADAKAPAPAEKK